MLPRAYWPGLALALGGSALYLVAERFLDINTLSATLFGLATYGLLGLWLSPRRWIEGLPAALLLIGALPFGEHLETFVGYPLRLLTARLVSDGLAALGVPAVNVDTILVLESGFSQVDSPCSGIKSLWTGALFLLAATWLERHPINLRWIGATILVSGLLLAANVARVGVLVLVGEVAGWRVAAEMLHVPLGVLGFVAVCGLALTLLKLGQRAGIPGWPKPPRPLEGAEWGDRKGLPRPVWFIPALGLTVFIMGLLYAPRPEIAQARAAFTWSFPADLNIEASPLSPPLFEWATEGGADAAERWRFETGDLRGSMLFLTSHTWRGQHRPERCFEVEGLTVDASQTYLVAPDFPVRYLTLKNGPLRFSAAYWLQTTGRVTEDYATRIWADLAPQRQPWVLVTVLFDDQPPPEFPAVQALFQALRGVVAQGLNGGLP
jgi:exosortase O